MHRCTIHALYRSKLWQQDHCQYPQNANPDGSTLEGTTQRIGRPFGGGGAEAQGWGHRQEDLDLGVYRKCPGNHWWNSTAAYSPDCQRFRRFTHNCACVKKDLKCRSHRCQTSQILTEKTKNLRLIKSVRLLNKLKHPKKQTCSDSFQTKRTSARTRCTTARTIAGLPRITGTCPGWWKQSFRLRLWSLVWFQVRATSCHLTSSKSAWKLTPKCTWMCWRVWWSPGAIRWPVADPGCGSRTSPKRPRLGFRRSATILYPFLTGPPPPPTWTHWTTSFGHTSRTSPIWPPKTPKPAWSPPSTEYSPSSRRRL